MYFQKNLSYLQQRIKMSKYVKRSIVFQDVSRDDVDKIQYFQSNYPLVITGLVSLFRKCLSSFYEDCYLQEGTKVSEWIMNIWGNEIEDEKIHFSKIRMNIMFQKYEIKHLDRLEWMLHAYLNEFPIYRIWNGIYDYVTIHDHQFFMKFLVILSTMERLEKNKMIEMANTYFEYLESQGENRRSSKIPNHFYPFVQKKNISMNIFFEDSIQLSIEIHDRPSPYMWSIHCMMRENIEFPVSPIGFIPISHDDHDDEEKIDLNPKEKEKVFEIENIVKEVIGYVMILYKDEIIRDKVNAKIQEWKEEKIQNVRVHLDMNVRNEVLHQVLKIVS